MSKRLRLSELSVGTTRPSRFCGEYRIIAIQGWNKIKICFTNTGYTKTVSLSEINTGSIKDFYYPTVVGIGYLGVGCYPTSYKRGDKTMHTPAYEAWTSRLQLCYGNTNFAHRYKDIGVYVCEEWLCFQNFAEWFYKQIKLYGKGGVVDKDLLHLGSKVYSPQTCCYIPQCINVMFRRSSGKNTGVYPNQSGKWYVSIGGKKSRKRYGTYSTENDAVDAYRREKITLVQNTAVEFQDKIDPALFYKLYTGAENYVDY